MDTRKDETVSKDTFLQKIAHVDKATLFFKISIALMAVVIVWIMYLTISISNSKGTRDSAEIIAIISGISTCIIALSSIIKTNDIPKRLGRTSKKARESLLTLQTKQFDLQKQKTELYEERSSLLWQEDALEVLETNPQAAILVSWIGVEQTLSRVATKLTLSDSLLDRRVTPLLIIESLSQSGYISEDETRLLKQMQEKRNRAVHGIEEEGGKIAIEQAVDYIQNAININSRLTLLQKREVLTKEEIA